MMGGSNAVELNQDIYVSIMEIGDNDNVNYVLYGKKIEKYTEPKYVDAFFATYLSYNSSQIVTTFTHSKDNKRKMQIKIGKINDKNILQKIKNNDGSGFSDLMTYAKSNSGIFDKIVNSNDEDYLIVYDPDSIEDEGTNGDIIQLNDLQNGEYYFLYVQPDDENGKYEFNEGVTLAKASTYSDGKWYLFFYGTDNFEWDDFEGKVPGILP